MNVSRIPPLSTRKYSNLWCWLAKEIWSLWDFTWQINKKTCSFQDAVENKLDTKEWPHQSECPAAWNGSGAVRYSRFLSSRYNWVSSFCEWLEILREIFWSGLFNTCSLFLSISRDVSQVRTVFLYTVNYSEVIGSCLFTQRKRMTKQSQGHVSHTESSSLLLQTNAHSKRVIH